MMGTIRGRQIRHGRGGRERVRRGVASVLAMLYLVIFSALAVGFYSAVTTSAQIAGNERRVMEAQVAAESGLQFIRYQVSRIKIPAATPASQRFAELYAQLARNLNNTPNLGGGIVGYAPGYIVIPGGGTGFVDLPSNGHAFRAIITEVGGGEVGNSLSVMLTGKSGGTQISRALVMEFEPRPFNLKLFDYGVAAYGKVKLGGDFDLEGDEQAIDGSIYSGSVDEFKTPVEIKKKASITGDVFMADADGRIKIGKGADIGGSSDPREYADHVHRGVEPPEFPTLDVSVFKPYATDVLTESKIPKEGASYYANIVIPPNTNPHFSDDVTLEGVIYVQMPNKLTFEKGASVRGVIVYEPAPGFVKEKHNAIEFKQSARLYGLDQLPVNAKFPQSLHDLAGASIIAPQTDLKFTGKSGAVADTILVDDMKLNGHPDMLIRGYLIALGDVKFQKRSSLHIARPNGMSPALKFSLTYAPITRTYLEVSP